MTDSQDDRGMSINNEKCFRSDKTDIKKEDDDVLPDLKNKVLTEVSPYLTPTIRT